MAISSSRAAWCGRAVEVEYANRMATRLVACPTHRHLSDIHVVLAKGIAHFANDSGHILVCENEQRAVDVGF